MIKRIGFACKLSENHPSKGVISIPEYNTQTTTVAWLNRQSKDTAVSKLWDIVKHNIEATKKLVKHIGGLEEGLRMVRLSSEILPMFTHEDWAWFYKSPEFLAYAERHFATIGEIARNNNVRLSFHPGQFCCIVSENTDIVDRSIEDLEYHTSMVKWMGFGSKKLEFKINVHLSGRRGVLGFDDAWNKMSTELRNCITLENDEYQSGIDDLLVLKDKVGIVLDIHHHWIHTKGEYISSMDDKIKHIIDSWQGVRPTIHYSVSREDYLKNCSPIEFPIYTTLMDQGVKSRDLRAHSNGYWNSKTNRWAQTHLEWADIMCESKWKNIASVKLYEDWIKSSYSFQNENETY